eukprot:7645505-Lingulodinium_polyedra.AAC.1
MALRLLTASHCPRSHAPRVGQTLFDAQGAQMRELRNAKSLQRNSARTLRVLRRTTAQCCALSCVVAT